MTSKHKVPLLLACLAAFLSLGLGAALQGQPVSKGQLLSLDYSESSSGKIRRLGAESTTSVRYQSLSYSYGFDAGDDTLVSIGVGYQNSDFSGQFQPIPDKLNELSLNLRAQYRIDEHWSGTLMLSPGYRYAGSRIQGEGFTTPIVLGGSYASSRDLVWLFGVAYREFSEYSVLPYVGVYWRFSPKWTFTVGYPRLGLSYELSDGFKISLAASGEGGSYYVKEHSNYATIAAIIPGRPNPLPANVLKDTTLDYREIRVGLAIDVKLSSLSKLSMEGGVVTDRKWQYHRYDVNYDGKSAAYGRLALNLGF